MLNHIEEMDAGLYVIISRLRSDKNSDLTLHLTGGFIIVFNH
jgi:hypothetical protein